MGDYWLSYANTHISLLRFGVLVVNKSRKMARRWAGVEGFHSNDRRGQGLGVGEKLPPNRKRKKNR